LYTSQRRCAQRSLAAGASLIEFDQESVMPLARKADVIVGIDCETPALLSCLKRVLECSGPNLNCLIAVADAAPGPDLKRLTKADPRFKLAWYSDRPGNVELYNRGLSQREGDTVLLQSDTFVTAGWLEELATVAHSTERTSCAAPLSNGTAIGSIGATDDGIGSDPIGESTVRTACAGLPRETTIPRSVAGCVYLRTEMIGAVGLLDPGFTSVAAAVDDWVMRAQTLGLVAKRANQAYVERCGPPPRWPEESSLLDRDQAFLEKRHPQLGHQIELFASTVDCRLAEHAVRLKATGKLRLAYDIRHLPAENVGTRTYAVNLAKALAERPDIELTLLVRWPEQAEGLEGRILTQEQWRDDVAVIHKPAQIFDRRELALLFGSSAHLVVTYQDLIAYRIPAVFPANADHVAYRTTSNLSMHAVQRIVAYSECAGQEIVAEFCVPREEVVVTPLGVERHCFAHRQTGDVAIHRRLNLPPRYFFSLATDFPHKNLQCLLDAYSLLRSRWTTGQPPELVLAGYSFGQRERLYDSNDSEDLAIGLNFLGPVSADELRVLYRNAEALVYPSLYEGFGLPPLEAMAAGTPVIAMSFSSVPEVGGDAVLYSGGLSPADLAQAMEHLANDDELKSELTERGLKRAEQFRWEKTADAVVEVYRSAVLRPTERSLHARRMLREGILHWSEPPSTVQSIAGDDVNDTLSIPQEIELSEPPSSDSSIAGDDFNDLLPIPQEVELPEPSSSDSSIAGDDVNDLLAIPQEVELPEPSSSDSSMVCDNLNYPWAIPLEGELSEPPSSDSSLACDDVNDPMAIPQEVELSELPTSDSSLAYDDVNDPLPMPQSIGVRNAWRALNFAMQTRMRKELSRFRSKAG
jgi:glycosyltransferase involved in cell wall biosynthesis